MKRFYNGHQKKVMIFLKRKQGFMSFQKQKSNEGQKGLRAKSCVLYCGLDREKILNSMIKIHKGNNAELIFTKIYKTIHCVL